MSAAGTVLDVLFGQLRKRKSDVASDSHSGYRSMLADAVEGREIDADEARIVLVAMGKSPDDFASDVETYRKRLRWAAALQAGPKAEAESRRLHAEIERRGAELNEYVERERAAIRELIAERQGHDAAAISAEQARTKLLDTAADPGLLEREAEIRQRQTVVADRLRVLDEQLRDHSAGSVPGELSFAKSQLAKWQAAKFDGPKGKAYVLKGRHDYQVRVDHFTRELERLQSRRSELQSELAAIGAEMDQVNQAKLVP